MMLLDCSSNFCCMTLVRLELVEWGVRRETSAKGPNKTVCQAVRNRRQFWWHTDTTQTNTNTHTLVYRPKYRSLLVNLHGNMQMSLLARCQCQRQTPTRGHWRLSSFPFCFILFSFSFLRIYFWEYIPENRIISRSLVIILWDPVYFWKLTIYLLMSLGDIIWTNAMLFI